MISRTGQADRTLNWSGRTLDWQKQDYLDRAAREGLPGQVCKYRTARIRGQQEKGQTRTV